MIAVISITPDDLYLFNLPFAVYSWHKIGVRCLVLWTPPTADHVDRMQLAFNTMKPFGPLYQLIEAPPGKAATYAQCSRLYAAAISSIDPSAILITSDADMCVFDKAYWEQFEFNGAINVIGSDLVPKGQFPICYLTMPVVGWRHVMDVGTRNINECLNDLLGEFESDNFRGNYWSKDQEEAYRAIKAGPYPIVEHFRSNGNGFAARRMDRDSWQGDPRGIIDAHLPRPGYTLKNFNKIIALFNEMYPDDNHDWMANYWECYQELIPVPNE